MISYFDSSLALEILFGKGQSERATAIYVQAPNRISSILFKAECLITLRRANLDPKESPLPELPGFFETLSFKLVNEAVIETLEREPLLAECRTLDAIHLATALCVAAESGEPVEVCTFDQRMLKLAGRLNLTVRTQ